MKKILPLLLLALGLLFGGCAMTVPLNPSLLMLLKDDAPAPTLEITPKANEPVPVTPAPTQIG